MTNTPNIGLFYKLTNYAFFLMFKFNSLNNIIKENRRKWNALNEVVNIGR